VTKISEWSLPINKRIVCLLLVIPLLRGEGCLGEHSTNWSSPPDTHTHTHTHKLTHLNVSQSQSCSATWCLPQISLSWRLASWGNWPVCFYWTLTAKSFNDILSYKRMRLSLMTMLGFYKVCTLHVEYDWKLLLLQYMQLLCQSRLCKADHSYLI
jgi:hypothetical protein